MPRPAAGDDNKALTYDHATSSYVLSEPMKPVKNVAFTVFFPVLDADGDLVTGAAGLDSEVSLNGGAFADCTNEAAEIGSSGMYSLLLTAAEMNADAVVVVVKTSTSGAKTTPIVLYPWS